MRKRLLWVILCLCPLAYAVPQPDKVHIESVQGTYLPVSDSIGHSQYHTTTTIAQTDVVIITPGSGQKIRVMSVIFTSGSSGNAYIYFSNEGSANPLPPMYNTLTSGAGQGYNISYDGGIDATLILTCPTGTAVYISYDLL